MNTLTIVLPLLPGRQEAWRQFCQALQGSRCHEYAAWRERVGITQEEVWLSQSPQGDLVRIHLQTEHSECVFAGLPASHQAFDQWLQQQLFELHGLDLRHLASASMHELIFVWSPTQFLDIALDEDQRDKNKERNRCM